MYATISVECGKAVNKDILLLVWIEKCDKYPKTSDFIWLFLNSKNGIYLIKSSVVSVVNHRLFFPHSLFFMSNQTRNWNKNKNKKNALTIKMTSKLMMILNLNHYSPIVMCLIVKCWLFFFIYLTILFKLLFLWAAELLLNFN